MKRRKFVKYTGIAGIAAGLFPLNSLQAMVSSQPTAHLMKFGSASTQIRHGALNIPFASSELAGEMPFQWVLDVHQNIFLKDGFQRNIEDDMNVISIALQEEGGFDALQINKQSEHINILWKEQCTKYEAGLPLRQIDIEDENYIFQLGHISKGESLLFIQNPEVDYFVQVIEGQVQNEEVLLDNESGLGLISEDLRNLHFDAVTDASILVIERRK